MGDETFDVGFSGVGRAGFDRRDHTSTSSARLVFSPGHLTFTPAWWLQLSVSAFRIESSAALLRPVNVQGSRYRSLKTDQQRVGVALLLPQPSSPLVLWPRTSEQGLAIVETARRSGFTVEQEAQSLAYDQIDVLGV